MHHVPQSAGHQLCDFVKSPPLLVLCKFMYQVRTWTSWSLISLGAPGCSSSEERVSPGDFLEEMVPGPPLNVAQGFKRGTEGRVGQGSPSIRCHAELGWTLRCWRSTRLENLTWETRNGPPGKEGVRKRFPEKVKFAISHKWLRGGGMKCGEEERSSGQRERCTRGPVTGKRQDHRALHRQGAGTQRQRDEEQRPGKAGRGPSRQGLYPVCGGGPGALRAGTGALARGAQAREGMGGTEIGVEARR